MRKALYAFGVTVLLCGFLAVAASGAVGTKADIADGKRLDNVHGFNIGPYPVEYRETLADREGPYGDGMSAASRPRSVGSALSPSAGIGPGVSIDMTWNDVQYTWGIGRQINTYWNGETGTGAKVSVHFAYRDQPDTTEGYPVTNLGYNVYDATVTSNNWPRGQDVGCDLQSTDTIGWAWLASMDMMHNGRAVLASISDFFLSNAEGERLGDNMIYYQGSEFNCTYDPRSALNVTWLDTTLYRPNFMDQSAGNYSRDPQVVTQWDGTNTIVHLVLGESNWTTMTGDHFSNGTDYNTYSYYRKVGDVAGAGTWSAGQILDTTWFVWGSLAAAPYPYTGVAFTYTNVTYHGGLLNNAEDNDLWTRESFDRGLTWQEAYSITNYFNALSGHPAHAKAWVEAGCMFDSEGDLHAWWGATPTSDDPYFDGFNWNDFNNNLYHWEKNNGQVVPGSGDIVKVANGNFMDPGNLTGSMNTLHCGFGGSNALYLSFATMGECDGKLYLLWSQIHERANRFPWRDAETQPAPGILDDCSVVGDRLAMANWEILMSVAKLETSSLWDYPRNVSDTYTPNCGIIGLEGHEEAEGPCGSEWKPAVELYALDEDGLSLTWPVDAIVDLSPGQDYAAGWYLNMHYMDDQFPGPYSWGRTNPPGTENSEKWIRLACVEPIEASQIRIEPFNVEWPEWVELGQSNAITVTVFNEGNVMLNITEVGTDDDGGGWLSVTENPTPSTPFQVTAGVVNTATFDVVIDASGLSETTWLDGEVWLKSDAANDDSVSIPIHVLAAAEVEPMVWDTVTTHANMFDQYFLPEGECVALAIGNAGDLGWGAGSSGSVNLDYVESEKECGDRSRDGFYLIGASAFTIIADDENGTNAALTQSFNDGNQADEAGFDPIGTKGSISGGVGTSPYNSNQYDSAYTGRFVNRDTSIAFERIIYGPRSTDPANEIINFVILYTKVYSADGAGHNHVTVGNVVDWDVPAEEPPDNTSGLGSSFVYMQGTDTTGTLSCQSHTRRYATEAFGGGITTDQELTDPCTMSNTDYVGFNSLIQTLMVDTTHYRNGDDLVPDGPMPDLWWEETAVSGLNADETVQDQAIWFTYKHNYNLGASDTMHYWTVLSTVRDGTLADLESQVSYAKCWYLETILDCTCGCCEGRVGDANGIGGDEPTIGDVSVMIDAKFITGTCDGIIDCLAEADINQTGGPIPLCSDITIGDISILIDYLFITGPELGLNSCL